jgi:hypothetical protein
MIIRRDAMARAPNPAASYIPAAATYPSPTVSYHHNQSPNPSEHITTATINKIVTQEASSSSSAIANQKESAAQIPGTGTFIQSTLNQLHEKEAIQKEDWDRERKQLLQKATNSQGDSVERLLVNYLAI